MKTLIFFEENEQLNCKNTGFSQLEIIGIGQLLRTKHTVDLMNKTKTNPQDIAMAVYKLRNLRTPKNRSKVNEVIELLTGHHEDTQDEAVAKMMRKEEK